MLHAQAQKRLVSGFGKTGNSNTRLNSLSSAALSQSVLEVSKQPLQPRFDVSIDYLTFRLPIHSITDVESVASYLSQMIQDEFVYKEGASFTPIVGNNFSNYSVSTRGCQLYWNLPQALDSSGDMMITLKGKTLAPCNFMERVDIILQILNRGGKLTRIDPCIDAFDSSDITFDNLFSAYQLRNYSGCARRQMNQSGTDKLGTTFYFGSRESAAFLRIYDKSIESGKTDISWWRVELELKQKKAEAVGKLIYENIVYNEKQLKQLVVDLVTGQVDFVDRGGADKDSGRKEDISRCKRLEWWQNFIDSVNSAPLRLSPPAPQKSHEKTINWFNKQICPSLAMLHDSFGERQFQRMIRQWLSDGRPRLNDTHEALIRQAKKLNHSPLPA